MCVSICAYTYFGTYVCVCMYVQYVYMLLNACVYVATYAHDSMCMYLYVLVHLHSYMYICTYIWMHRHVYTYIHNMYVNVDNVWVSIYNIVALCRSRIVWIFPVIPWILSGG